jgi:hypothetical protein
MSGRSVRWYIDRVRAMDPTETRHRVGELIARKQWARAVGQGRGPTATVATVTPIRGATTTRAWSAEYDTDEAERIMAGQITQLGVEVTLDQNWLRDPLTGVTAPSTPAFQLPLSDKSVVGDVRQLWEVSRTIRRSLRARPSFVAGAKPFLDGTPLDLGNRVGLAGDVVCLDPAFAHWMVRCSGTL